jgi:hypothetical protein
MIRGGDEPSAEDEGALGELGLIMRNGVLRSRYGPWRVRELFNVPLNRADGPIWTFDRMGQTCTELPDGRVLCVGGEHEDSYDPDFCIYNDVVVLDQKDRVEIYGYPREVFPPTDFHTATLVGDWLAILGCLGYPEDRRPGHTPVHALDLSSYCVAAVETSGDGPGWIFKHEAECDQRGVITVRGGEVIEGGTGEQRFRRNVEEFALDTRSWLWHRLTNRDWPQFAIRQEDRSWFVLENRPEPKALMPCRVDHVVEANNDWDRARIVVGGVPVSLTVGVSVIEVIIEGELPGGLVHQLTEEIRANAEAATGHRCVLERV